jgi:hypothetical protein
MGSIYFKRLLSFDNFIIARKKHELSYLDERIFAKEQQTLAEAVQVTLSFLGVPTALHRQNA